MSHAKLSAATCLKQQWKFNIETRFVQRPTMRSESSFLISKLECAVWCWYLGGGDVMPSLSHTCSHSLSNGQSSLTLHLMCHSAPCPHTPHSGFIVDDFACYCMTQFSCVRCPWLARPSLLPVPRALPIGVRGSPCRQQSSLPSLTQPVPLTAHLALLGPCRPFVSDIWADLITMSMYNVWDISHLLSSIHWCLAHVEIHWSCAVSSEKCFL